LQSTCPRRWDAQKPIKQLCLAGVWLWFYAGATNGGRGISKGGGGNSASESCQTDAVFSFNFEKTFSRGSFVVFRSCFFSGVSIRKVSIKVDTMADKDVDVR
jgi:hypothetical protein